MSIAKFSKDVFILSSDKPDLEDMNAVQRDRLDEIVSRLISRFIKLGFREFKLIADNSLSEKFSDELLNHGIIPTTYQAYPTSHLKTYAKIFDKDSYEFMSNGISLFSSESEEDLILSTYRTGGTESKVVDKANLAKEMTEEQKITIICNLMAAIGMSRKTDYKSIRKMRAEYVVFSRAIGLSPDQMIAKVKKDLEGNWEWACEVMSGNPIEEEEKPSPDDEDIPWYKQTTNTDLAKSAVVKILGGTNRDGDSEEEELITSTFLLNLDKELIMQELEQSKAESALTEKRSQEEVDRQKEMETMNLLESLLTYGERAVLKDEAKATQYTQLLDDMDNFYDFTLKTLIRNSLLIVDCYSNKSNYKSRKLPYADSSLPKMILSVDLKTGEVDCTFKGSQFKINQFFEKGEEIQTHIMEW